MLLYRKSTNEGEVPVIALPSFVHTDTTPSSIISRIWFGTLAPQEDRVTTTRGELTLPIPSSSTPSSSSRDDVPEIQIEDMAKDSLPLSQHAHERTNEPQPPPLPPNAQDVSSPPLAPDMGARNPIITTNPDVGLAGGVFTVRLYLEPMDVSATNQNSSALGRTHI
ncbi:hypothetical protein QCA50_019421 [Cerrena zonata]|uniref:Uncharacterized protein n=1 Tax=Cerrena zonata TaxID=2478898 RepID=A0AAW0F975_9APHY